MMSGRPRLMITNGTACRFLQDLGRAKVPAVWYFLAASGLLVARDSTIYGCRPMEPTGTVLAARRFPIVLELAWLFLKTICGSLEAAAMEARGTAQMGLFGGTWPMISLHRVLGTISLQQLFSRHRML